jgi:hypothetical protein
MELAPYRGTRPAVNHGLPRVGPVGHARHRPNGAVDVRGEPGPRLFCSGAMARAGGAARSAWTPGAGSSCVASNCVETIVQPPLQPRANPDERGALGVSTCGLGPVLEIR